MRVELCWNDIDMTILKCSEENPFPLTFCPPQTPHKLAWDWNWVSALWRRWLNAWTKARSKRKTECKEDRRPKRIQIASYQEISMDEKGIEKMNSRSNERGVEPDDVQNLLNYWLWREERCAGVYSKLTIRSLKSMKHQEVGERSIVKDFTLVWSREEFTDFKFPR